MRTRTPSCGDVAGGEFVAEKHDLIAGTVLGRSRHIGRLHSDFHDPAEPPVDQARPLTQSLRVSSQYYAMVRPFEFRISRRAGTSVHFVERDRCLNGPFIHRKSRTDGVEMRIGFQKQCRSRDMPEGVAAMCDFGDARGMFLPGSVSKDLRAFARPKRALYLVRRT